MDIIKIKKLNDMEKEFWIESYFSLPQLKDIKNEELRIKQIAYLLAKAKKIVAITGAGISTDSGIADFRSKSGIYSSNPEELFSLKNFNENPMSLIDLLLKIFNNNFEPNYAHMFLKRLEFDKEITIITQNIDNLHKEIHSNNIISIHGSVDKACCNNCGNMYEILWGNRFITRDDYICDCKNVLKPNIVLYGEDVKDMNVAIEKIEDCDLILILGSSLLVEPVASLPLKAKLETPFIIINNDPTPLDNNNNSIVINKSISKALKEINDLIY